MGPGGTKSPWSPGRLYLMAPTDYYTGFNNLNDNEWIWGQRQIPSQSNESYSFNYLDVSSDFSGYYSFMADPNFKTFFDGNDIRTKLIAWDGLPSREGFLRYAKFKFRPDQTGDIVLMRSAEIVLIQAEGYARNSNLATAVQYLNELRSDDPNIQRYIARVCPGYFCIPDFSWIKSIWYNSINICLFNRLSLFLYCDARAP